VALTSIIASLRGLLGRPNATGIGFFRVGGGQGGPFIAQSYDFMRIANTVYTNPTGYRCVLAIESNFSRPPWAVLPRDAAWPQQSSAKPLEEHPLLALLNRPNPAMSGTMMQRQLMTDLELSGKSFWAKTYDAFGGQVSGLRRLATQRMTVIANMDDELLGFIYTDRNGRQAPIMPENIVYLRYPHPERTYDGMAPGLIAGLPAEVDTAASRFNRDLLSNDGAIPGYLILEGLSVQGFQEWKTEWEKGALPGKTRFLTGTQATYAKVGQSNQELTYAELRQDSQDDIMRSFGVPRAVAFDVSHETYANAEREQALFMQHNILPKWVLVADELTLQLGDDFATPVRAAFELAGIDELQDSRDAVVDRATKLMGYQATTINEFRRSQGQDPVPWGDEPVQPIQPMSAVPLAAPAPENQPAGTPALPGPPDVVPAPTPKPSTNGNGRHQ
jgi:HK97 family phage portal protein